MGKVAYLVQKAWQFGLEALQRPGELPRLIHGLLHGAHPAEYIKMLRYRPWLERWDVRTVLDVGAHVGEFATAARVMFPRAHIYSFEPQPQPFARLSQTMRKRGRWTGFPVALGAHNETKTLWASPYTAASSLRPMARAHRDAFPWTESHASGSVQVVPLDALRPQLHLRPRVLLKMDVQGYELEVLRGAEQTLREVTYCLVETSFEELYEGMALFQDIYRFLTERGFVYRGAWSQFLAPEDRRILQQDALFIRVDGAEPRPSSEA
ncbi:MAG: FkbM family methyltransferase [Chloroflexi bacterium]|nr:FkbM family methyltransferase [Chloroflexota bacterium]